MRVLCVCLGNICRSPTAEGVLRHLSGGTLDVESAGTAGWHAGKAPYPPAVAAAAERGYDLAPLQARHMTSCDFEEFDLILVMDAQNLADVEMLRPEESETPVRLFLDFAPETGRKEVPDPYHTGDFESALDLIEAAARGLLRAL